jgi:quercetin dioxygenase-like cupin family protein
MKRRKLVLMAGTLAVLKPLSTIANWLKPSSQTQEISEAFYQLENLEQQLSDSEQRYLPFLNVEKLRTGLYVLPRKGEDKQQPHAHDEVYYVVSGKSKFMAGSETTEVSQGSVLYVKAHVAHHFFEIEEELKIIVFFSNMT